MNRYWRLSLVLLVPIALFATLAQSNVSAQDRLTVQPRRVVIIRSGKVVRDFPERRKAIVRYPIVRGLSDPAVLRRIQNTLRMKNVFDSTLEDYRKESGLLTFDYKVNYNKNYLFDITFNQETEGAYPDTQTKHFLISLKSGMAVKGADVFNRDSLATLARLVDQKLQGEIRENLKANEEDKYSDAEARGFVKDELNKLKFGVQNLDDFSVGDEGVTFLFDAGFAHAIRALQPNGDYFFSYAELRPYLKGKGPLGTFK